MTSSIIIVILIVIILICIGFIAYLKIFKKYTRERFAFFGVTTLMSLITSLFVQIYSSQGYGSAIINTLNVILNKSYKPYKADMRDHIIAVFIITVLAVFIYSIFKTWNGPISEKHFEKNKYHEEDSILKEFVLQIKDFFSKEKLIVIHNEEEKNKDFSIFSPYEEDKIPWYESVYELLTDYSYQYQINPEKDYYKEEQTYISRYGQEEIPIAILCSYSIPNDSTLRSFILFTQKQKKKISKYIIAIKNTEGRKENKIYDGIELEYRYENELLNSLVDFSSYHEYIKNQFTKKEISIGSNITLEKFYVESKAKTDAELEINKIEDYIFDWLKSKQENKHLSILAEYGCGKSVLSLKIAYELLEKRTEDSRIPILIELRGKSPRTLSVIEILSNWASNFKIDPLSILKLHKSGKLLLIFEGFDEMDMVGDREMRLNHFQRLWEFAIAKSKIIITGRPNFFLDDKELKTNLGINKPYANSHYCEAIYLEKFDKLQIDSALRNIEKNTKDQIIDILNNPSNSNFYDLISRPAILYLVAVIWKERKLSEIKDKINSAKIISEFIFYSYSRQNDKKSLFPLTEKEREYFMLGAAIGMIKANDYSNQISKSDLENVILKLYRGFPNDITNNESATQTRRKSLKERMIDNNQDEETILTDVRSCGILVNDLTRKDYFKFAHKSFLEQQVSFYFVESIIKDKNEDYIMANAISKNLDFDLNTLNHSNETIAFTAEILISKLNLDADNKTKETCKKLFKILYPKFFWGQYPKLGIRITSFSFIITLMIICFLPFFLFMLNIKRNLSFNPLIAMLLPTIPFIIFTFFIFKPNQLIATRRRILIWLQCCQQLNIPKNIIIEVISAPLLKYINNGFTDRFFSFPFKRKPKK